MRLALGEREVAKAQRRGDQFPVDFQPYINRMMKWDLGQLAHRVRTQLDLPDDPWLQIFKDAKELRNNVAHDFWSPYYALLQSEEGIELIVRHCSVLERHFAHLAKGLVYATGVNMQLYLEFIGSNEWTKETKAQFGEKIAVAEKAIAELPDWPEPNPGTPGQVG